MYSRVSAAGGRKTEGRGKKIAKDESGKTERSRYLSGSEEEEEEERLVRRIPTDRKRGRRGEKYLGLGEYNYGVARYILLPTSREYRSTSRLGSSFFPYASGSKTTRVFEFRAVSLSLLFIC